MKVLILTGPAGAGKSTIAHILAKKKDRCAVVDVDAVRWMLLQPHKAPWDGSEGKRQQMLGVKNTCELVKNFIEDGSDVIISDVLSQETLQLFRKELANLNPKIVLLLPSIEEIQKRNKMRPPRITEKEIAMLYKSQEILKGYDEKINNTKLSAEEVTERIKEF